MTTFTRIKRHDTCGSATNVLKDSKDYINKQDKNIEQYKKRGNNFWQKLDREGIKNNAENGKRMTIKQF